MEVIYTLIPGMIFIGLLILLVLRWAVRRGQYEDFEGDSQRILLDEDADNRKKKSEPKADNAHWPDAD